MSIRLIIINLTVILREIQDILLYLMLSHIILT